MGSLTGANHDFLAALQSFQDYFGTFEKFNSALSPVISEVFYALGCNILCVTFPPYLLTGLTHHMRRLSGPW